MLVTKHSTELMMYCLSSSKAWLSMITRRHWASPRLLCLRRYLRVSWRKLDDSIPQFRWSRMAQNTKRRMMIGLCLISWQKRARYAQFSKARRSSTKNKQRSWRVWVRQRGSSANWRKYLNNNSRTRSRWIRALTTSWWIVLWWTWSAVLIYLWTWLRTCSSCPASTARCHTPTNVKAMEEWSWTLKQAARSSWPETLSGTSRSSFQFIHKTLNMNQNKYLKVTNNILKNN